MGILRQLRGKRPRDAFVESHAPSPGEKVILTQARGDLVRDLEQLGEEYAYELQRMLRFMFDLKKVRVVFQGIEKVGPSKEINRLIFEIVDQNEEDDLLQRIRRGVEGRILRRGIPKLVQIHFRYRRVR